LLSMAVSRVVPSGRSLPENEDGDIFSPV
jgi:hypothetical protein